jgi:two-component system, OmpR family, phosphate regulon sensor histidine kinase PhoR
MQLLEGPMDTNAEARRAEPPPDRHPAFERIRVAAPGEAVLLEQLEQLSIIFDSMDALLYVADFETYELLYINAYGRSLFGEGVVGHPCFAVLQSAQGGPCAFCTNHRLVRDGVPLPPHVWEFRNTVTGRWFQCIDSAIRWTDGRLVRMEVAVDITERKRAESFARQYVHTISHDLRNPLMAILGHVELLRMASTATAAGEQARKSLDAIGRAAHRIDVMVQDLVDSARLEAGAIELHRQPVELGVFLRDVLEEVAGALAVDRVRVELPEGLPRLDADPDRLERILVNLLSNALKYSPPTAPVRVSAERDGLRTVISVTDLGRGIDAEDLARVFDPYFRTAAGREAGGLGLGLHITRMLVEAHGGWIRVESEPGAGSRFSFTLEG